MDTEEIPELEDDDLDNVTVEVPLADKRAKKKDPVKELDSHMARSDKLVTDLFSIRAHQHDFATDRFGKTKCVICSKPKITPKQSAFAYRLWAECHGGLVTPEAQEFIHSLTVGEASDLIDRLYRGVSR